MRSKKNKNQKSNQKSNQKNKKPKKVKPDPNIKAPFPRIIEENYDPGKSKNFIIDIKNDSKEEDEK